MHSENRPAATYWAEGMTTGSKFALLFMNPTPNQCAIPPPLSAKEYTG